MKAADADTPTYPRIVPFAFASPASSTGVGSWMDERGAWEMSLKGWVGLHVETEPGVYYEIIFYDPVRLRQTMESVVEGEGAPCFAEYAPLVLLPELTVEAVENSVKYLWEQDYFSYWKPDEKFEPPENTTSL